MANFKPYPKKQKEISISQQTASRHLIELENAGYITKTSSFKGIDVRITEKGLDELRRVYFCLKKMIESVPNIITIYGILFSGLGEGGYYVSQKQYQRQFKLKLGFYPYLGTLNLKLPISEIVKKKELETYPPIIIKGFEKQNRLFGDVRCYPTIINHEIEGAAIIIERTHHDSSILEVIAPVQLRTILSLTDGDKVTLADLDGLVGVIVNAV